MKTYLIDLNPETNRFTCPECGKPDRALTKTGKIWDHDRPKSGLHPKPAQCSASGARALTEPLSGAELVSQARELGRLVHATDKDKTGEPYEFHLAGVAQGVEVLAGFYANAIATAWLHDTIEDHPSMVSAEKLLKWGFPKEVVDAVVAVTKLSGEEQGVYLQRIIDAGDTAMLAKLADLLHNTRFDRLAAVAKAKGESTRVRLLKKYTPAKARLMLELGIIQTEEGQALATKPVGTATGGSWTSSNSDGSSNYSGKSLIAGDWPAGWSAPIQKKLKDHDNRYILEDGTAKIADPNKKYKVWSKHSTNAKAGKDWTPAQEKQPWETESEQKNPQMGKLLDQARSEGLKVTEKPEPKASTKLEPTHTVTSLVPKYAPEPVAAKNAPRSLCGYCGMETYKITSHFWKHINELPKDIKFHTASRPTEQAVKKLLELGRVSYGTPEHTVTVTKRLNENRVQYSCSCGNQGVAADILKRADSHIESHSADD